jgi:3,4-dihydroxy 2-butanone 4-phosphate synthase/GTP cyclohydrolase II
MSEIQESAGHSPAPHLSDPDESASARNDGWAGLPLRHLVQARIPTEEGEFQLHVFRDDRDGKEHLALVRGELGDGERVLTRIHSECFTGDVLGSLRCDCGDQLQRAMHLIGDAGRGVIVYLRQEGRGIGLVDKLRAYNLQDRGYDTVDANLILGHQADERDYRVAAWILNELGVHSIELLTNNPHKIEAIDRLGITVLARLPIQSTPGPENLAYLETKAARMDHLLDVGTPGPHAAPYLRGAAYESTGQRPRITVTYLESLDGQLSGAIGGQIRIADGDVRRVAHRLRAAHDALIVSHEVFEHEYRSLGAELVAGPNPRVVVVDDQLRLSPDVIRLAEVDVPPWIIARRDASLETERALEAAGGEVLRVDAEVDGHVDLQAVLAALFGRGIESVLVEGDVRLVERFLQTRLVDELVVTVVPDLVGGNGARGHSRSERKNGFPRVADAAHEWLNGYTIIWGTPTWDEQADA